MEKGDPDTVVAEQVRAHIAEFPPAELELLDITPGRATASDGAFGSTALSGRRWSTPRPITAGRVP
ncbi:hypothetical protein [Dactylosporangium salmoneum]|uniref:hypothetical protein n=1 Tax=Dactylosporangium salmoneum TaxID=53361 RepID=UPI0031DDA692